MEDIELDDRSPANVESASQTVNVVETKPAKKKTKLPSADLSKLMPVKNNETSKIVKYRGIRNSAMTEHEENLFKEWMDHASEKSSYYHKLAGWNRWINSRFTFISLILGAFTAGAGIFNAIFALSPGQPGFAAGCTIVAFVILNTLLTSYLAAFKVAEKASNYHQAAMGYSNFSREWKMQLAQGIDDRPEKIAEALINAEMQISDIEAGTMAG